MLDGEVKGGGGRRDPPSSCVFGNCKPRNYGMLMLLMESFQIKFNYYI